MCCVIRVGAIGDDLAGVQDSLRIEDLLQLAKHVHERAILLGQEWRAAQAVAMLAADRAAQQPDFFVKLGGERFHRADIVVGTQIEEWPNVQLALSRVAEDGGRHLQMLERVLNVPQKDGQCRRRAPRCLRCRASDVMSLGVSMPSRAIIAMDGSL